MNAVKSVDDRLHLILLPDGDAQAIGQPIRLHPPGDDAIRLEVRVRRPRIAIGGRRKTNQDEVADAVPHVQADPPQFGRQPSAPAIVMGLGPLQKIVIADGGDAGDLGRRRNIERVAHAVEDIGNGWRTIGPAQTEPPKP